MGICASREVVLSVRVACQLSCRTYQLPLALKRRSSFQPQLHMPPCVPQPLLAQVNAADDRGGTTATRAAKSGAKGSARAPKPGGEGSAAEPAAIADRLAKQVKAVLGSASVAMAAEAASAGCPDPALASPGATGPASGSAGLAGAQAPAVASPAPPCHIVSLTNPRGWEGEAEREQVVRSLGVVDTPPERRFDAITQARGWWVLRPGARGRARGASGRLCSAGTASRASAACAGGARSPGWPPPPASPGRAPSPHPAPPPTPHAGSSWPPSSTAPCP